MGGYRGKFGVCYSCGCAAYALSVLDIAPPQCDASVGHHIALCDTCLLALLDILHLVAASHVSVPDIASHNSRTADGSAGHRSAHAVSGVRNKNRVADAQDATSSWNTAGNLAVQTRERFAAHTISVPGIA
eukprot:2711142-Rhodomonas_salina.5